MIRFLCSGLALVVAAVAGRAHAEALPEHSGIVDVRRFGAKGDGTTDDTAAIRAAISAARADQGRGFWPVNAVYFPAGDYRVSDTLWKRDASGRFLDSMALIGESARTTRIILADNAPAFADAEHPRAVVYTSSGLRGGSARDGDKDYAGKGEGNDAYGNYVEDLTIDVGRGNPGAVAIDFLANNTGAIRNVELIAGEGSGGIGIGMDRKWPGPLLLSNVGIHGFAVGISVSHTEYGVTMENVRLTGQSNVAIRNHANVLSLRQVVVETAGVALQNASPLGLVVIDHMTIRLTSSGAVAVQNQGYLTFRDLQSHRAGASPRRFDSGWPDFARNGAFFGHQRLPGFEAAWRLAARPPPAAFAPPPAKWVSVADFGARADSGLDATTAIRDALNSGAELVFFPSGRYVISDAIAVPARVRRIAGMFSSISILARRSPAFSREMGMLRVATGGEPLIIDRLTLDNTERGHQVSVEHSGARELLLRDLISAGTAVERTEHGGALFLENTCGGPLHVAGKQGVWARQFNSEGEGTRIVNRGAPLSILGLKVEQNCTVVENMLGAQTEILGGLLYMVSRAAESKPAFINHGRARMVAAYVESAYRSEATYRRHFVGMPDSGAPTAITADALPRRGLGRIAPGVVMRSSL